MSDQSVPDVGAWFRHAGATSARPRSTWEPRPGTYGRTSPESVVDAALDLVRDRPTLVLTGAGMSTDSGLPDYRGRDALPRQPMTYDEFVGHDLSRRRYWARSTVGWRWFGLARPNDAHQLLAQLAELTPVSGIVTQNVDGLHQAAGSSPVVELHGSLAEVVCLDCGRRSDREALQAELLGLNPGFATRLEELAREASTLPDGDAEVDRTEDFRYPNCPACGGLLKPDVVFFGENARADVVAAAFDLLDQSESLLVLGSSLSIMSGLRFVRRAASEGKDIVIVNDGDTRGDDLATIRVHGRLADVLGRWTGRLSAGA